MSETRRNKFLQSMAARKVRPNPKPALTPKPNLQSMAARPPVTLSLHPPVALTLTLTLTLSLTLSLTLP